MWNEKLGIAVFALLMSAAPSAKAACSYSIKTISESDAYSSNWDGTQELADCSFYFEGASDWNAQDYTTTESQLSFTDRDAGGTKYSYEANGVTSYHNEIPGYRLQDFVQTWSNSVARIDVWSERGVPGETGWSRSETHSLTARSDYQTVGTQDFYGGMLIREYTQTGSSLHKARSNDYETAAGGNGTRLDETLYSYSETGRGSDYGNGYSYESSLTQKSLASDLYEFVRDGLGGLVSHAEQSLGRNSQAALSRTVYDDGRAAETQWSYSRVAGARSAAAGSDSVSASGERTVYSNSTRNEGTGYSQYSDNTSISLSSFWSRDSGGGAAWGSDYYNSSRQNQDNTIGSNRTVQDTGSVYANRSGSAGESSYSSWYRKAWSFVNGLLVSVVDQSGSSGDASLAAFYANFDPAVCEQFRDVANAQNADYSYWGLCLDVITPTEVVDPAPAEPEACYGKAQGQDKNSKGQENGKGAGLTKNRCAEPSDSGNGKKKV